MNTRHTVETLPGVFFALALAGALLSFSGCNQAPDTEDSTKAGVNVEEEKPEKTAVPAAAFAGIQVSFKLDPRVTKGLYMGDRWISSPVYTGGSAQDTIEAKAYGLDAKGGSTKISPQWIPADPEMVTVSPAEGHEVKITVKRVGESVLKVTSAGVSTDLAIKATGQGNALQVEIAQPETKLPTEAASEDSSALKSRKEKVSYALGMNLGNAVRKQSIETDTDLMIQGLKDTLSGGKTLLTEEEARVALVELQNELKSKQVASQGEKKKALGEKNNKEGEAFLAQNKAKEGIVTLASGLQYKILSAGKGKKPGIDDTVVCHYRGTLIDGTEFDSSFKRGQPATFALKRVIKGWTEALQLMSVGSKWQLFIPASLAYGEHGTRGIGPNATLIFEVELISIQGKP